jgi:hypothetical protein
VEPAALVVGVHGVQVNCRGSAAGPSARRSA